MTKFPPFYFFLRYQPPLMHLFFVGVLLWDRALMLPAFKPNIMCKKGMIFSLIFLSTLAMHAQPGFNKVYLLDSCCAESFESLVVDKDTIVVMRSGYDTEVQKWGINLLKIDTLGNVLQSTFLSDSIVEYIRDSGGNYLVQTPDGGYAFSVTVLNDPACPYPCINLAKFNHNLELEFNRHYSAPGPSAHFAANRIYAMDDNSGFVLLPYLLNESAALNSLSSVLLRTDDVGEVLWFKKYSLVDTGLILANYSKLDNNSYLLTGSKVKYFSNGRTTNSLDIIVDSLGIEKNKYTGKKDRQMGTSLIVSENGIIQTGVDILFSGTSSKTKPFVRKLDSLFSEQWIRYANVTFGSLSLYHDLLSVNDGNYIGIGDVGGVLGDHSHTGMSTKISDSGEVLWERFDRGRYGSFIGTENQLKSVGVLSSGSMVACGSTWIEEPVAYSEKSWLIKLSPGGCMDDTDTLDCWAGATVVDIKKLPTSQEVQVYPNPVGDELTIQLTGDLHQKVYVYFYDVTGRFLRKQRLDSAYNILTISDLPKGMIFYTINSTEGVLRHGKLVVDR